MKLFFRSIARVITHPYVLCIFSFLLLSIAIFAKHLTDLQFSLILIATCIILILAAKDIVHYDTAVFQACLKRQTKIEFDRTNKIMPEINKLLAMDPDKTCTIMNTWLLLRFWRKNGYLPSTKSEYKNAIAEEEKYQRQIRGVYH